MCTGRHTRSCVQSHTVFFGWSCRVVSVVRLPRSTNTLSPPHPLTLSHLCAPHSQVTFSHFCHYSRLSSPLSHLPTHYQQVTQRPSGPLTPAQLERVRELLLLQHNAIATDAAEVEGLAVELEAWKLEHPEVELPARLAKLGTVV